MQPLLLLKQTLEANYDPGPLLLDGPNVSFASSDSLLSRSITSTRNDHFLVGAKTSSDLEVITGFQKHQRGSIEISFTKYSTSDNSMLLHPGMKGSDLKEFFPNRILASVGQWDDTLIVSRNRCFLIPIIGMSENPTSQLRYVLHSAHLVRIISELPSI
jgi:hypothetical protein